MDDGVVRFSQTLCQNMEIEKHLRRLFLNDKDKLALIADFPVIIGYKK